MAEEKSLNAKCEEWRHVYRQRRFGILLVILIGLLAGSPVVMGFGMSAGWFDGLMLLVLLPAIQSLCFERRQRTFALLVGTPTIVLCLAADAFSGIINRSVLFVGHLCAVLFFFGSAALIVGTLFRPRSLTLDSMLGAVCGYLFLGLAWAMSYSTIEVLSPDSFQTNASMPFSSELARQPYVLIYYSFVTLTTLGYGDVVPITPATRTLAWIEAITGQFYLAIVVAGLVSLLVANAHQSPIDEDIDSI